MDLKETQKKLLELMVAMDGICRKEGILYTLHGGTLLGAVREKGFIPWDDDMDVAMTRAEFHKLETALVGNEQFHIVGDIKKQFRRMGETDLWVDIFICDPISHKSLARKMKLLSLTALDVMNRDKNSIRLSDFAKYGVGKRFAFRLMYWCGKLLTKKAKIRLYGKVSRDFWVGDRSLSVRSNDQYKGRQKVFSAQWMHMYTDISFADRVFAVSRNYHEMLVSFYGEDYMTPVKEDRNSVVHDMIRKEGNV